MIWNKNFEGLLLIQLDLLIKDHQELEHEFLNVLEHSHEGNNFLILLNFLYVEMVGKNLELQIEISQQFFLSFELINNLLVEHVVDSCDFGQNFLSVWQLLGSVCGLEFLEVIEALIDLLDCVKNVVDVALDVYRSLAVLVNSRMEVQLGACFAHYALDVLSLLADKHRALALRNEDRQTQSFVLGVKLHMLY